jgi:DNA (cytosine-5)-methyltransferase 1
VKRGDADVLIGGPPCQPFSKSGYWVKGDTGRLGDPRSGTLGAFMRVLEDTLPRTFVLENVEGLAYAKKSEGLKLLLDWVQEINRRTRSNYQPTFRVLRAADYGVPQRRERFFMVASREGDVLQFPSSTHAANPDEGTQLTLDSLEPYRTAWDALADVEPAADEDLAASGKWAELLPSVPEGENYLWHTERGGRLPLFGWRRRYWSFLLKLAKNRPSWTVQAQPGPATGPFHWDNRRLSMRELCRLQTFPDDVVIHGGRTSVQRQVGNAVPSLLAEVIGRAIRRQLLGQRVRSRRPKLLPPDRSPAPAPERVQSVANKFRALAGNRAAHPGTGRGYRASDRPNDANNSI